MARLIFIVVLLFALPVYAFDDGIPDDSGSSGGGDAIIEGDSSVEVIDTGTGQVQMEIDSTGIIDFYGGYADLVDDYILRSKSTVSGGGWEIRAYDTDDSTWKSLVEYSNGGIVRADYSNLHDHSAAQVVLPIDIAWPDQLIPTSAIEGFTVTKVIWEPDQKALVNRNHLIGYFPAEIYPDGVTVDALHITSSATSTDVLNFQEWTQSGTSSSSTIEQITLSGTFTEDDGTLSDNEVAADGRLMVNLPASPTNIDFLEITAVCHAGADAATATCTSVDYTGYDTFQDEDGTVTVAASTITLGSGHDPRSTTHYYWEDMGAAYYSGDFKFRVQVNITTSDDYVEGNIWLVSSNNDGDRADLQGNSRDYLRACWKNNGVGNYFQLVEGTGGSENSNLDYALNTSTTYYIEIERDDDLGTYGTLYARIYSDSGYSNLLDSQALPLTKQVDYRYLGYYAGNDTGTAAGNELLGTVSNLCEF